MPAPPDLPGASANDSPLDRALALMLADEREAALRWSAAVVEQDDAVPSALILTCRLLADFDRTEAAIEGFRLGLERAIDSGNLPLAVAAIADLRKLGANVDEDLDEVAAAFCMGSPRLDGRPRRRRRRSPRSRSSSRSRRFSRDPRCSRRRRRSSTKRKTNTKATDARRDARRAAAALFGARERRPSRAHRGVRDDHRARGQARHRRRRRRRRGVHRRAR